MPLFSGSYRPLELRPFLGLFLFFVQRKCFTNYHVKIFFSTLFFLIQGFRDMYGINTFLFFFNRNGINFNKKNDSKTIQKISYIKHLLFTRSLVIHLYFLLSNWFWYNKKKCKPETNNNNNWWLSFWLTNYFNHLNSTVHRYLTLKLIKHTTHCVIPYYQVKLLNNLQHRRKDTHWNPIRLKHTSNARETGTQL